MLLKLSKKIEQNLTQVGDKFSQIMALSGPTFRASKNRQTMRIVLGKHAYFIKQHRGSSFKEIAKNLCAFKLPVLGAKHEWLAIQKLSALHIPTTPLAGYGERYFLPTNRESFIITNELTKQDSIENLIKTWRKTPPEFDYRLKIIKQLAHTCKTMHQNGINHRDLYLCHFLLDHAAKNPILHIIDLHRAQIKNKIPTRMLLKDLSALYFSSFGLPITTKDLLRFLKNYFEISLSQIFKVHAKLLRKIEIRACKLYQKEFINKHCTTHNSWRSFSIYNSDRINPEMLTKPDQVITDGEMLTGEDTCAVAKATLNNHIIVIKRFNAKNLWHQITRSVRQSRARNCWNSAIHLKTLGIATPKPLAIIEKRWGPLRLTAYYLTEYVPGPTADHYFTSTHPKTKAMAKKLVKTLLLLRRNHIKHRDTKANNFIIANERIYLIDLDGMQRLTPFRYKLGNTFEHNKRRFMRNWDQNHNLKSLFQKLFKKFTR